MHKAIDRYSRKSSVSKSILIPTGSGTGTGRIRIGRRCNQLDWPRKNGFHDILKPDFNDFVIHDGYIYGFDRHLVYLCRLATGERVWKQGRYGAGQVLLLKQSETLLIVSEKGEVVLLKPDPSGHQEIAKIDAIDGKTWNHPVVIGDRLYVRNAQGSGLLPTDVGRCNSLGQVRPGKIVYHRTCSLITSKHLAVPSLVFRCESNVLTIFPASKTTIVCRTSPTDSNPMYPNLTIVCLLVCLSADQTPADEAHGAAQPRWWKGNLHTHSLWSDGDQFPEMIGDWYRERGYNFLALTDHNVLSRGMRWMKVKDVIERSDEGILQRYRDRYGDDWVETARRRRRHSQLHGPSKAAR